MNSVVYIKKNPYGDTRTAPEDYDFEKFCKANSEHRESVSDLMYEIGHLIAERGRNHDITKTTRQHEFYNDFVHAMDSKKHEDFVNAIGGAQFHFVDGSWYKMHVSAERHHLNANVPVDVDLIDILEMMCDCVCAGLARSGHVRDISIPYEVVEKAMTNTMDKLAKSCVLTADPEKRKESEE